MPMKKPVRIYFLCVQNRCRSQIAEAFAAKYGGRNVVVHSAGLEAADIHPLTVEAMKEVGIDLSGRASKRLDMRTFLSSDVVVKLCERLKERCPVVPFGIQNVEWNLPDPLETGRLEDVRRVRDAIEGRVVELLKQLNVLEADHGEAALRSGVDEHAELFKLLGDKTRLSIVALLKDRERCVCDLVELLQTSQPNISQHLRKLKDAGLLRETRRGQWIYYALRVEEHPVLEPILSLLPAPDVPTDRLAASNSC